MQQIAIGDVSSVKRADSNYAHTFTGESSIYI